MSGFKVAVHPQLSVKLVLFILCNDLAGGKVFHLPVVTDALKLNE